MNTDKLYITIKHTIAFLFKSCLLKPCLIAICALFIIALIRMIFKAKPIFKSKKQALSVFILFFYLAVVFEITLFMRLSNRIDENLIMLLPHSFVISVLISATKSVKISNKLIIYSSLSAFLLSVFIEVMQIIAHLGTFQISDIVYNTLGGIIGGFILILIKSKKKTTV